MTSFYVVESVNGVIEANHLICNKDQMTTFNCFETEEDCANTIGGYSAGYKIVPLEEFIEYAKSEGIRPNSHQADFVSCLQFAKDEGLSFNALMRLFQISKVWKG